MSQAKRLSYPVSASGLPGRTTSSATFSSHSASHENRYILLSLCQSWELIYSTFTLPVTSTDNSPFTLPVTRTDIFSFHSACYEYWYILLSFCQSRLLIILLSLCQSRELLLSPFPLAWIVDVYTLRESDWTIIVIECPRWWCPGLETGLFTSHMGKSTITINLDNFTIGINKSSTCKN